MGEISSSIEQWQCLKYYLSPGKSGELSADIIDPSLNKISPNWYDESVIL